MKPRKSMFLRKSTVIGDGLDFLFKVRTKKVDCVPIKLFKYKLPKVKKKKAKAPKLETMK